MITTTTPDVIEGIDLDAGCHHGGVLERRSLDLGQAGLRVHAAFVRGPSAGVPKDSGVMDLSVCWLVPSLARSLSDVGTWVAL